MEEIEATRAALVPVSIVLISYDVRLFVSAQNCSVLERVWKRVADNDSSSSSTKHS
jgi:hypothetical protein